MRDLDETDMEILSLLAEDARRPFSSIGEEVDLSGPAVSDRVKRLEDADIINGFTIDVNRAQLRAGVPVFVQLENDTAAIESLRSRLHDADGIEHLFVTAEGKSGSTAVRRGRTFDAGSMASSKTRHRRTIR